MKPSSWVKVKKMCKHSDFLFATMLSFSQAQNILNFLLNILGNEESSKLQALICIGLAKLMLSGMISDERVNSLP